MPKVNDRRLEQLIGQLLRGGVLLAAAVVAFGAVLYLFHDAGQPVHYSVFQPMSTALTSITAIASGAFHLESAAVIQLGVLLLIATPVARVLLAMVGFCLERDYLYTVVSATVLTILIYSLMHTA